MGSSEFRLLMLSAMYENGGNTTHRLLDGHPQLYTYPFESQIGTRLVQDALTSMFPVKYRWPEFKLTATPAQDYHAIIDEEGKVRSRTPDVSKFRDRHFDMSDDERRDIYVRLVEASGRSRADNVAAFFTATFEAWKNVRRSGREEVYVGYSPIIAVDAEKILTELPAAHVLEVVRNPWSAFADTKKRPVPLGLADYILGWVTVQHLSLAAKAKFPDRMHILRLEDILADPVTTLGLLCRELNLGTSDTLGTVSWNGQALDQVYPWGTIRTPTVDANMGTALELAPGERDEIRRLAGVYLGAFGYDNFLDG